ncbi:MAG: DNA-3-methyladenine glycosylase, partial [Candidatus Woesearchaeota archaeon]
QKSIGHCKNFKNKKTKRTRPMYKTGGFTYIYLIYGIYHCLNIVTGRKEKPQAVLIRAAEPVQGLDIIKQNRKIKSKKLKNLTNGPGKLCEALNLDKTFNNIDLVQNNKLYIINEINENIKIKQGKRKNIDYAEEYRNKKWRFYIKNNQYIS